MDGFFYSCVIGLFSILTNELGDRTFLLTALFCAQNTFWKVFPTCMAALLLNCIISIVFGRFLLPLMLEDVIIDVLSSSVLFISGLWMVWNALRDFILELEEPDQKRFDYEEDQKSVLRIFIIIFLAELGDRSQLATFALSTSNVIKRNCAHHTCNCLGFLGYFDWYNLWTLDLYTICLFSRFRTFSESFHFPFNLNWWDIIYIFGNFTRND